MTDVRQQTWFGNTWFGTTRFGESWFGRLVAALRAGAALVLLGGLVAGCGTIGLPEGGHPDPDVPRAQLTSPPPPARGEEREHARILASYGGAYADGALQSYIDTVIRRLVAASDRPDLSYRVTILNSPVGQRLRAAARARSTSPAACSRWPTTAPSWPRCWPTRWPTSSPATRWPARSRAAPGRHRLQGDLRRAAGPPARRAVDGPLQAQHRQLLARSRSWRRTPSASTSAPGPASIPMARRAFSSRWPATARCATRTLGSDRAGADTIDFLSSHPSTPERLSIAITNARQFAGPGEPASATATAISPASTG